MYKYLFVDLDLPGNFLLLLVLTLNIALITVLIPATTIAEEKEKFTLRTLMLSNVKGGEFFTAKVLLTCVFLILTNVILFFICEIQTSLLPMYLLITTLGSVPLILLGLVAGMLARDQMNATLYEMPLLLLFMLPAIFGGMNRTLEEVIRFTPGDPILALVSGMIDEGLSEKDFLFSLGVIGGWLVVAAVTLALSYRKRGRDN